VPRHTRFAALSIGPVGRRHEESAGLKFGDREDVWLKVATHPDELNKPVVLWRAFQPKVTDSV
jgi:hypothetical protein